MIKPPTNRSIELAQKHPRWPAMERVEKDRATLITPEGVWRWYKDHEQAKNCCARSTQMPLSAHTVPMSWWGDGWTLAQFIEGRHPDPRNDNDMSKVVLALDLLHGSSQVSFHSFVGGRLRLRALDRLEKNHPKDTATRELLVTWMGWKWLVGLIGPWHGDPTINNTIIQPDGSVRFIDHSFMIAGPREYDLAKLRRSMVIGDDGNWVVGTGPLQRGDHWLAIVLAGMIGSHVVGKLRNNCLEAFREITRED
jgi:hypothetical protein